MEERRELGVIELVDGDKGFRVARVRFTVDRPEWMYLPGRRNRRELRRLREKVGRGRDSMEEGEKVEEEGYAYLQGGEEMS